VAGDKRVNPAVHSSMMARAWRIVESRRDSGRVEFKAGKLNWPYNGEKPLVSHLLWCMEKARGVGCGRRQSVAWQRVMELA